MSESDPAPVATPTRTAATDARARTECLVRLVDEFRTEGLNGIRYPDEDDDQHRLSRIKFAKVLCQLPNLEYEDLDAIKEIWTNRYGKLGQAAGWAHRLVNDETKWLRVRSLLYDLCFGGGSASSRIDDVIANEELPGVKLVIPTKLLAICYPDWIIPNYPLVGESSNFPGKLDMIKLLDQLRLFGASTAGEVQVLLEIPHRSHSIGDLVIRSNDVLLELLHPYFSPNDAVDTWGMAQFLYWLAKRYAHDDAELTV